MEEKVYITYNGQRRSAKRVNCEHCDKEFLVRTGVVQRFCSLSCSTAHRGKKIIVTCDNCGIEFEKKAGKHKPNKSGLYFCSNECRFAARKLGGILECENWGSGGTYRQKALKHYGKVCASCGYSGNVKMLDVDHIDSNREHNEIENLQVLCVWCHALKTRGVPVHERIIGV